MEEVGAGPSLKRLSYRVINKVKPFKPMKHPHDDYVTDLQIDASAPKGIRKLEQAVTASFSKHR